MNHELDEIISILESLSDKRIEITPFLFERFVNGSPDRVLKAIEQQMNAILDEYQATLINVIHRIYTEFNELRKATLNGEHGLHSHRKDKSVSRHTR